MSTQSALPRSPLNVTKTFGRGVWGIVTNPVFVTLGCTSFIMRCIDIDYKSDKVSVRNVATPFTLFTFSSDTRSHAKILRDNFEAKVHAKYSEDYISAMKAYDASVKSMEHREALGLPTEQV